MKKLGTVRVTRKDIKNGERNNREECPVALALARTFGLVRGVMTVEERRLEINDKPFCTLPASVCKFILAFDAEKPVKPFSFTL